MRVNRNPTLRHGSPNTALRNLRFRRDAADTSQSHASLTSARYESHEIQLNCVCATHRERITGRGAAHLPGCHGIPDLLAHGPSQL